MNRSFTSDSSRWQLATARLQLSPFAPDDADELLALFRDPAVRRYLLDDELVDGDWIEEEVGASEIRFADRGDGLWAIRPRDADEVIGFVGFRDFFEPPRRQLLYALLPEWWGQGLTTEAALAACRHAFDELGYERIEAATDVPNTASMAVLERIGFERVRTTDEGPAGTAYFELTRAALEAAVA